MSESVSGMVGFEGEAGALAQLEAATSGLPPGNDGARTNWLWLAEISRWERALDLGRDGAPQMAGLAEHFRSVHYLGFDRSTLGRAWTRLTAQGYANVAPACATPLTLPYRDGTFDCVTLDEEYAGATLLEECRRILRPGGCLYVGLANPRWWGRAANGGGGAQRVPGLKRQLARAGFSLVRVYCAEPSYEQPRCVIPLDRRAVLAYERLARGPSLHGRLRRALAWLGLGAVLYRSLIYLAYR